MKISADVIRIRIERMNDDVLIASYQSGDMTEDARQLALEEIQARGLNIPTDNMAPATAAAGPYPPSDSVVAATFLTPTDAHIFKALLEAEGIPATVADANFLQAYQFLSTSVGGVRVLVPESLQQHAREVFQDFSAGKLQLNSHEAEGDAPEPTPTRSTAAEGDGGYGTAELMRSYVFQNTEYYGKYIPAALNRKLYLGFNFLAALFGITWLAVRKMYLLTAIYGVTATLGLAALHYSVTYGDLSRHYAMLIALSALSVLRLGLGLFANTLYLTKARRVSLRLQSQMGNNPALKKELARVGGTSAFACMLVLMASITVNMLLRLG